MATPAQIRKGLRDRLHPLRRAEAAAQAGYIGVPQTQVLQGADPTGAQALARARAAATARQISVQPSRITAPGVAATTAAGGAGGGGAGGGGGGAGAGASNNPYDALIRSLGAVPTQQSLLGNARTAVQRELGPMLAQLAASSGLEQRQLQSHETRAAEFAKALAAMNMQSGAGLTQQYQNAVNQFGAVGTGLTGAVAQDWQNQTAQAQEAVNQMTGGLPGQDVSGYDPSLMRNVSQLSGVALPATTLGEQALRAGAGLQAQAARDVGSVFDVSQEYGAKLDEARATAEADRVKAISQRPELVQKALDALKGDRQTAISNLAKLTGARADYETAQQTAKLKSTQIEHNYQIDKINADTKAASAKAYNDYIAGKTDQATFNGQMKKINDAANIRIKQATLKATTAHQVATETISQKNADIAQQKANTASQLAKAKLYLNPKSGNIEPIPNGTYIGKDGLPHKVAGTGSSTSQPSYTDVASLQDAMDKNIRKRLHVGSLTAKEQHWDVPRIKQYLMRNYGRAYLSIPKNAGQTAAVNQMIDALAQQIVGSYKKKSGRPSRRQ